MKLNPETLAAVKTLLCADGCPAEEAEAFIRAARNPKLPRKMGTVKQAAAIIQCHPRTVQRYGRLGLLHPVRLTCRRIRYDLNEVERLAEGGVSA